MADPDLETELDRIHALPLGEFIGARNELAKRLKAAGGRDAADQVKALAKPSVTAWAVNALYHRERQRFDELLEAAGAVRAALGGKGDRRKAEAARRQALKTLLGRAGELLAEAGHAATPASRQRISHTLETLAARDPAEDGPRPGRLTADLEPQGFDVLAGLAASLPPPAPVAKPAKAPGRGPRGRATAATTGAARAAKGKASGARGAKGKATAARAAARNEVAERQTALDRLERDAEHAEAEAREAVERHERLTVEAIDAERLAKAAAKAAAQARTRMAEAKAAATTAQAARRRQRTRLATAKKRLERLEG